MAQHTDQDFDYSKYETPAMGVDLYLGFIYGITGKTADKIHFLDCGSGPGHYVKYLFQHGLGKATLLDSDAAELEKARESLRDFSDKLTLVNSSLPDLPFQDSTFDAISFNNILHHMHDWKNLDYSQIAKTVKEAHRVLKNDGVIIISEPSPIQDLIQWCSVYPNFIKEFLPSVLPSDIITNILKECGFVDSNLVIRPDDKVQPRFVYTGHGKPFEKCELPEYSELVELLSCPNERKRLHKFANCVDELKPYVGCYTIHSARKNVD